MTSKAPGPEIRKRGRPPKFFSAEQRRKARTIQRWHQRQRQSTRTAQATDHTAEFSQCGANSTSVPDEPVPGPVLPTSPSFSQEEPTLPREGQPPLSLNPTPPTTLELEGNALP